MSGTYPWSALTPKLRESIEMQPIENTSSGQAYGGRTCGCHERMGTWWLCQYHDGFQDAEAIMLTEVERLTAELAAAKQWEGPHSRACGFRRHDHGPDCHPNCPTCYGAEGRQG